jgi:hypothetical protein
MSGGAVRVEAGATCGADEYLVTRLVTESHLAALVAEAHAAAAGARPTWPAGDGPTFWCVDMAAGGPALTTLRDGAPTLEALRAWTGEPWVPVGTGAPRFSYYRRPYHFSGLHRDRPDCELSVITCVVDTPGTGGDLVLFPGRCRESLDAVRATPDVGAVTLRLAPGESLLVFGSAVPHAVTPVAPGRTRIVLATCYRRVTSDS